MNVTENQIELYKKLLKIAEQHHAYKDQIMAISRFIDAEFETKNPVKTHYFTVTDEEGRTAGIIKASTSEQLKKAFLILALEHYVLDDTQVSQKLLINNFIGQDKTVTVKGIVDGDEEIFYDLRIESVLLYE